MSRVYYTQHGREDKPGRQKYERFFGHPDTRIPLIQATRFMLGISNPVYVGYLKPGITGAPGMARRVPVSLVWTFLLFPRVRTAERYV
jgi:hypothetical protein